MQDQRLAIGPVAYTASSHDEPHTTISSDFAIRHPVSHGQMTQAIPEEEHMGRYKPYEISGVSEVMWHLPYSHC